MGSGADGLKAFVVGVEGLERALDFRLRTLRGFGPASRSRFVAAAEGKEIRDGDSFSVCRGCEADTEGVESLIRFEGGTPILRCELVAS